MSSQQEQLLEQVGSKYHEHRRQIMLAMQCGLTETYNFFHREGLATVPSDDLVLDDKVFEKKFGKSAAQLRKHLVKTSGTCTFNEAVTGIIELRRLHVEMDNAVLEAYGWAPAPQLPPGEAIELNHGFYEVDYLPENDRIRYTIHPDARKEVLKRLLELNHQIHEEEERGGGTVKGAKVPKGPKGGGRKGGENQIGLF